MNTHSVAGAKKTRPWGPGGSRSGWSGSNRFPHASFGKRPVGLRHGRVVLHAAADHADESAHHEAHHQLRIAGLELATRLRRKHDTAEQREHPLLERAAVDVE